MPSRRTPCLRTPIHRPFISWHTALNIWAVVSRMFRDACRAKQRDLRVREDNPALGVEPPDRGTRKGKQFLYPSEFTLIVQNDLIPRAGQRLIALAIYLFPRGSAASVPAKRGPRLVVRCDGGVGLRTDQGSTPGTRSCRSARPRSPRRAARRKSQHRCGNCRTPRR
jgi:hypothetical protein